MESEAPEDGASGSVWACGVCDVEMEEKTPSIACQTCRQWVHLGKSKCARMTINEGLKLSKSKVKKFKCSRCTRKEKKEMRERSKSHKVIQKVLGIEIEVSPQNSEVANSQNSETLVLESSPVIHPENSESLSPAA